jgi:hypothetical protein
VLEEMREEPDCTRYLEALQNLDAQYPKLDVVALFGPTPATKTLDLGEAEEKCGDPERIITLLRAGRAPGTMNTGRP